MGKIHDEAVVITQLQRKGIKIQNGNIKVPFEAQIGNRTYGKLDFLVHHKDYTIEFEKANKKSFDKNQSHISKLDKKYQKEERKLQKQNAIR